ncbi:hypothetical protein L915_12256, partial [Phytophthora nicotianae]
MIMLLADWNGHKHVHFAVYKNGIYFHRHIQDENDSIRHGFWFCLWTEMIDMQSLHGCRICENPTAWWNLHIPLELLQFHFGFRENIMEKILLFLATSLGTGPKQ